MKRFFQVPVAKSDATDGISPDTATGGSVTSLALKAGWYKLAAVVADLRWALGYSVQGSTGSYLAAKDQELIHVPGNKDALTTLYFFVDTDSSEVAGRANVVPVTLFTVPGADPRKYDT